MRSVNVFVHRNGAENLVIVNVRRERQLHEDAVDIGAIIELSYAGKHHLLANICRQLVHLGMQADFAVRLDLVMYIDFGGEVVSDEDYR
jgi:hypothetical protein